VILLCESSCCEGRGRLFSAGADVRWHGSRTKPAPGEPEPMSVFDVCDRLRTIAHPSVAVVHGACIGGALAIGLLVRHPDRGDQCLLAIPRGAPGILPGIQSGTDLRARDRRAQFRRYAMTGQRFGAEEALAHGLAHQLAAPQDLEQALAEQIEEIPARRAAGGNAALSSWPSGLHRPLPSTR